MKQRILVLLLATGLCLGLITAASVLAFSGVSGEKLSETVEVPSGLGTVSGYPDGSYHPDDALIHARFRKPIILTRGYGDQAQGSIYRTWPFDMPDGDWTALYVNLAYEEGLVVGCGDDRLGPGDPVTVEQAVTMIPRLLGYTVEEIGPFWLEGYLNKARALGFLDDLPAGSGAGLIRGDAVPLPYRVPRQTDQDGQDYIDNLCTPKVTDAVLPNNNAKTADGTPDMVEVYTNQTISWYESAGAVPDCLAGRKSALLLDEAGKTVGSLSDDSSHRTLRPAEAAADGVTAAGGDTYAISSGTRVLLDGAVSTYGDCWYELRGRERVMLYYTDSEALDLVVASGAAVHEGVMLTGYHKNVNPNTVLPASITLLGVELEAVGGVAIGLSALVVDDRIIIALNGAVGVISAYAPPEKRVELYGVLQEDGVELACGLTVVGKFSIRGASVSELAWVSPAGIGALSVYPVSGGSQYTLDPPDGILGNFLLSENVKLHEWAGSSTAVETALEDILMNIAPASRIDFYVTDKNGEVCLLLLGDVTGNAFTYGLPIAEEQIGGSDSMTYTNRTVSVENSNGVSQVHITGKMVRNGTMDDIVVLSEGKAVEIMSLKRADVNQADFDEEEAVVVGGSRVSVSSGAEVYNQETGRWTTLPAAKSYGAGLIVYYSGALDGDAVA